MNTNAIHNIMNWIIGACGIIGTILLQLGCTNVGENISCVSANVPTWLAPWLIGIAGALGIIKSIMNLVRDGFGGLFKEQPPVADDTKTVVVTTPAGSGNKVDVAAVTTTKT